ncbi:MAG: hypothetical protein JWL77_5321 [Chthonomonadaceae bacterium]|nr:hypothetical protein [Chthonomonadaceae bacterium]
MTDHEHQPRHFSSPIYTIMGLAVLVRCLVAWHSRFTSEDFLITLRYAENLAHGQGLVFNPGEHVLGTTTPLYTLFLAAVSWLGLPAALLGKLVNILADAGLCLLIYRLLRGLGEERAGLIAALCVAFCPLQIQWSISGMETSLVSCCGMAVWVAFAERRTLPAYVAAGLLFLLRWDGILVGAVLTLATLQRDRRLPYTGLLAFALILLPWLLFATRFYGNPIPVTAGAKSIVYGWRAAHDPHWLLRHFPSLPKLIQRFLLSPGYGVMTLLACAGLVRTKEAKYSVLLPPALWFALYWLAFLFSRVLLFPWYIVPPLAVYEVAVGLGGAAVWGRSRHRQRFEMPRPVAILLIGVVGIACTLGTAIMTRREQEVEERVRIPLALWLKTHSRPTDSVMLEPIGYIAYYSHRPVLDVVGLVSPQVLPFYRPQNEAPFLEMARAFRPEWCVLRPGEIARIQRAGNAQGDPWEDHYLLVQTFAFAPNDNVYYVYRRR